MYFITMTNHWTYSLVPAIEYSELAHRSATQEFMQVGHFHDQVQIVAIFDGWRSFVTPVGTFWAEAGQIVVLPARLFHAPLMRARSTVSILYLDPEHHAARVIRRPTVLDGRGATRPTELLDRVVAASECADEPEFRPIISTLIDLVVGSEASIEEIAKTAGYSADGFIRSFSRNVGTTPAKYRIAHRLNVARALLKQGVSPADAACESGFADQSHLGRCFLMTYGTTPGAYREGMRSA